MIEIINKYLINLIILKNDISYFKTAKYYIILSLGLLILFRNMLLSC